MTTCLQGLAKPLFQPEVPRVFLGQPPRSSLPPPPRAQPGRLWSSWLSSRVTQEYVLIFIPALPVSASVSRAWKRVDLHSLRCWRLLFYAFPCCLLGRPRSPQRLPAEPLRQAAGERIPVSFQCMQMGLLRTNVTCFLIRKPFIGEIVGSVGTKHFKSPRILSPPPKRI